MPKENIFAVLGGGGGLTSRVAAGVTWWRRLNLEGGGECQFGGDFPPGGFTKFTLFETVTS